MKTTFIQRAYIQKNINSSNRAGKIFMNLWHYGSSTFRHRELHRHYSTHVDLNNSWEKLQESIESINSKRLYPGSIYASTSFKMQHIQAIDFDLITLAFIQLIEQYAYTIKAEYVKVTIGYSVKLKNDIEFLFTLGKAIPLFDLLGKRVNKGAVYDEIDRRARLYGELYQDSTITGVFIRIYYEPTDSIQMKPMEPQDLFRRIVNVMEYKIDEELPEVKSLQKVVSRIPNQITRIKRSNLKRRSFIVADIETILVDRVHVPYAAGYLVVNPGDDLTSIPKQSIRTYFSEDYQPFYDTFKERSHKMLFDFLYNLELHVKKNPRLRTVYFHNFSRFDGILILKHYSTRDPKMYKVKILNRNNLMYEMKVYIGGKFLLRFRDSLILLPASLESLGKTLCPELGQKGSIPHDDLNEFNIQHFSEDVISYLRMDILLLGGIMLKTQEINWDKYKIDVEDVMTLSSLSLKIFRKHYFNDQEFIINIPTRNEDTFIRRGYYGGHVDVYKPTGENLYYYDVNSLYPFVMKAFPMPSGKPTWNNKLEEVPLETLFGFIEAYVECPSHIKKPFLPFKNKDGTLLFPSGKFLGVYYSEELKYARKLGYTILPLRGYLFDMKPSPFSQFVSDTYDRRLEAKKAGDDAMSFVYKILMNSLYGRFGINPESTVTEICDKKRYNELMKNDNFQSAEKLNEKYYLVNFISNKLTTDIDEWTPPNMSAVHMAAAVTACARIHMYPYISRPDCYYTDTDSVVLGNPLPEEDISTKELGKFKLENKLLKGIFLAPKSYLLVIDEAKRIIKHKGIGKDLVTDKWYEKVLKDPSYSEEKTIKSNFRVDYKNIQILSKDIAVRLGLPQSNKRVNVYDDNNVWVDTKPKEIIEIGSGDGNTILKFLLQKTENTKTDETDKKNIQTHTPTLYKTKQEAIKAKKEKEQLNNNEKERNKYQDNPDKGNKQNKKKHNNNNKPKPDT